MIAEFPRVKDSPALLVQQLCQFSGLIPHRRLFIANGAVALLGQEPSLCFSNSASLEPTKQEPVSRCCRTLACLLTEVEGSDPYSAAIYDGIPLYYDLELDNVFEDDREVEFLTSSGLFVVDAATNDDDDIILFANTLRIQLAVSSNLWYWWDIRSSVEELFRRLKDGRVTAGLADEDILILVNTTIYIGRRRVYALANNDFWEENTWHTKHVKRTLDVLATLTLCRPNIEFAIRRQIC
ncbi:hypothetical protein AcV5_008952 [Taiwanofungus camphoratus]|nr:hypothetical protein AcV5_008952 [Antrodia cinnamomea]